MRHQNDEASDEVCSKIYTQIIGAFLDAAFSDNDAVQAIGDKLAAMTLRLYTFLLHHLPPTPAKFHYIFNLRDLGRVFEGILLATPDHFDSPADFIRIWRNEVTRTFSDRLNDTQDLDMVKNEIASIIGEMCSAENEFAMADPLVFGDFEFAHFQLHDFHFSFSI